MIKTYNKSTRVFAVILGTLTGFSGIAHGIFEISMGSRTTDNILEQMGAFTVFPDYLFAGIATSIISLLVVICSITFIHRKSGAHLDLLLSFLAVISGGGMAFILFILMNWMTAIKINSQLLWYKKLFNEMQINILTRIWKTVFITGFVLLISGVLIWIFIIPPGEIHRVGLTHYVCWTLLGSGFISLIVTIIAGFARDIKLMTEVK